MKRISRYISSKTRNKSDSKNSVEFARQISKEYKSINGIDKKYKKELYKQITNQPAKKWVPLLKYSMATALVLIIVTSSVAVFAQYSQPGDSLYKVKKAGQSVRVWVQPSYIKKVVDDRKAETEKLIKEKAPKHEIDQAKHEYHDSVNRAINSGYESQIKSDDKIDSSPSDEQKTWPDNTEQHKETEKSAEESHENTPSADSRSTPTPER